MSRASLPTRCGAFRSIANVVADTALDRPELRILPRMDLARPARHLDREPVARSIRVATIGDVEPALAKFDAGDRLDADPRAADRHGARRPADGSSRCGCRWAAAATVPLVADRRHQAWARARPASAAMTANAKPTVAADLVGNAALGDATDATSTRCR